MTVAHRHIAVLLLAMVVAGYQILKLEQRRADRNLRVDDEFDRAVALVRSHILHTHGNYHVLIAQRHATATSLPSAHALGLTALVVNRGLPVPQIEAELHVNADLVAKATRSNSRPTATQSPKSSRHQKHKLSQSAASVGQFLKFLVYDDNDAMAAVAMLLEQRQLALVVRRSPQA